MSKDQSLTSYANSERYVRKLRMWRRSLLCLALCLCAVWVVQADAQRAVLNEVGRVNPFPQNIKTVFVSVMENHNWTGDPGYKGMPPYNIKGNPEAPFINNILLPQASYASNYRNLYGIHPSLPNYLWMEAGTNSHILNDAPVAVHHHLSAYLDAAGFSWKAHEEELLGTFCPLTRWHDPFIFFDDNTNNHNSNSAKCIAHVRPLTELFTNLQTDNVDRYNFIAPNYCHSMHNVTPANHCVAGDRIKAGDDWLATVVPQIMASDAYRQNGVIFLTWDESRTYTGSSIIPMIVLSPLAKGNGYTNNIQYNHGSLLSTLQEIFVPDTPLLRDAGYLKPT